MEKYKIYEIRFILHGEIQFFHCPYTLVMKFGRDLELSLSGGLNFRVWRSPYACMPHNI